MTIEIRFKTAQCSQAANLPVFASGKVYNFSNKESRHVSFIDSNQRRVKKSLILDSKGHLAVVVFCQRQNSSQNRFLGVTFMTTTYGRLFQENLNILLVSVQYTVYLTFNLS
jgi:hypothetical protein